MKNKIYFFLFLMAMNYPSGTYAASTAFPTQRYAMVQDTIVIEEMEAEKAYQKAVSYYNSVVYYILATLLVNLLAILFYIYHSRADKNIEKALLFYEAVGDKEKVAVLKKLETRSNGILVFYMLSFFSRFSFIFAMLFILASLLGGSIIITTLLGMIILTYFLIFEAILFKLKSKVASKSDNNLTFRDLLGIK